MWQQKRTEWIEGKLDFWCDSIEISLANILMKSKQIRSEQVKSFFQLDQINLIISRYKKK